ncbi:hypothetical protein BN946_scf184783.g21 [Trametes cinnabarina]|uniref:Uncharacterized protein n=1 Tax=Pycnoporus cinnabarinus TaxID=5643 RepID=A0A060S6M5_PYCCI|nr:hypothetical protein BN946_scf184783.g21 [Trametes cinnabarina]
MSSLFLSSPLAAMDAALTPPLRIQPLHVQQISPQAAQKRLDAFLNDFRARSIAKHSGETTTAAQLHKLVDALSEEYARKQ